MLVKSGRGALQTKQENKRLVGFGKAWQSGEKLRVFYPLFINPTDGLPDIVINNAYGHSCDVKQLKSLHRVFIPSSAQRDEEGTVIKPDLILRFSRIAKLFLEGEKEQKLAAIAANSRLDKKVRDKQNKEIEDSYEDASPIIGPLRDLTTTECIVVPLNSDGSPNQEKIKFCSQDLSEERLQHMQAILTDPKCFVDTERMMLEVEYTMGSTGKRNQDGRVKPDGLDEKYLLRNTYPEEYAKFAGRLDSLPKTWEMIYKRNNSFHPIDPSELLSALSSYCVLNGALLDNLKDDEDMVKRLRKNADILDTLSVQLEMFDVEQEAKAIYEADKQDEILPEERVRINMADEGCTPTEDEADGVLDSIAAEVNHTEEPVPNLVDETPKTPADTTMVDLGI